MSLLTLMAMMRIWTLGFWRPRPKEAGEPPAASSYTRASTRLMGTVTAVLVVGGLVIALVAGPLASWSSLAAADLLDPSAYRGAVLDGGSP